MGETGLSNRLQKEPALLRGFGAAFDAAVATQGATAPNPPVGCALLDGDGHALAVASHAGAGKPHAEAAAIAIARDAGVAERIATVIVTLEPCSHTGRTPPCVEAILSTPARRVLIGTRDPNPHVTGGGAAALSAAGLDVAFIGDAAAGEPMAASSRRLIAPFLRRITGRRPWVTFKRAFDATGSMIPPRGAKTFTSRASLDIGHALRRRADAFLTGSGTILADDPLYTVRRIADHPGKRRALVVMDRRGRTPPAYARAAVQRGLDVRFETDVAAALAALADEGFMEVLVEAGPQLSEAVLSDGLWDEAIDVHAGPNGEDRIVRRYRDGEPAWEEFDVLRHR